jgi:cathepsin A (carboxypeptidase C)
MKITGLPNQNQEIFQGWIYSSNITDSYLYYQLFSAQGATINNTEATPLILYLEGGPGDSSTLTVWSEIGPYGVNTNINWNQPNLSNVTFSLFNREVQWTQKYHLLSIDNPSFVGFSYSSTNTFVDTTEEAAIELVNFLTSFYQIYPSLLNSPLYIVGRSYGGHWGPALAYGLLQQNFNLNGNIVKFGGLIVADGMVNAANQTNWCDMIYTTGSTDQYHRDF